jgi:septin family protein
MIVVSSFEITESGRRSQPWGATEGHQYKAGKYYNFREHPELITTHLEDFVEHATKYRYKIFTILLDG